MANFTYKPRSQGDWEKRERQTGSRFASFALDDFQIFSPKKGDNYIRILPPTWSDPRHYGYDLWVHYQVGPDGGTVVCLQKMKLSPCPICQHQQKMEAAGREDAGDFKPTRRVLVWLINRADEGSGEKSKGQPMLWAMPWTLDRDISKLCRDRQSGELYQIDHPTEGFDITFEREGEPPIVKYIGIQLARRPSAVDPTALEYLVQHPIDTTLQWRSYEEVAALFQGNYPVEAAVPAVAQTVNATTPAPTPVAEKRAPGFAAPDPDFDAPVVVTKEPSKMAVPAYCPKTISIRGEKMGCALEEGHDGDHDFGRPMTDGEATIGTTQQVAQPSPAVVAPTGSNGPVAVSPRASALRARFDTGGRK